RLDSGNRPGPQPVAARLLHDGALRLRRQHLRKAGLDDRSSLSRYFLDQFVEHGRLGHVHPLLDAVPDARHPTTPHARGGTFPSAPPPLVITLSPPARRAPPTPRPTAAPSPSPPPPPPPRGRSAGS